MMIRTMMTTMLMTIMIDDSEPDTEYIVSIRAFNHIGESVPEYTLVQTSKGKTNRLFSVVTLKSKHKLKTEYKTH